MGRKAIDMIGKRFGRLVVIDRSGSDKYSKPLWKCLCDCGNETIVNGAVLRRGDTKSCGCLVAEVNYKHGLYKTRIHKIWRGMNYRCNNSNSPRYEYYGGRGITICDEWQGENGFINFYNWAIENEYADDLEIDRIDNDGNYEPCNCRWITHIENSTNRRYADTINKREISSAIKGVSFRPSKTGVGGKWRAGIMVNGKQISLGTFDTEEEAAKARKNAELKHL